jgi:peptide methionine sulfoxide reductase msrA/msrB
LARRLDDAAASGGAKVEPMRNRALWVLSMLPLSTLACEKRGEPDVVARTALAPAAATDAKASHAPEVARKKYEKPSDEALRHKLSPEEYQVTQHAETEAPFHNAYWNNHEPGIYVDVATGEPLFSSTDKFDSGSGWPSFTKPIEADHVVSVPDHSLGMDRTEVRSQDGDSHLGHVFDDGPGPTGQRFCINSASLRFIPLSRLEAEGYGRYKALFEGKDADTKPTAGADAKPR